MKLQHLYSYTRRAVDAYQMIQDNDKIAVGISGGKDSLTLLYALKGLQRFYPAHFEIEAITVDLGFNNFKLDAIQALCDQLDIHYTVVHTQISQIVFEHRQEKNPCSLCSNLRKGAMNQAALDLGCNKIAYGHHKDDLVETMMMSLIYEGHFYAFSPVTYLERSGLTLIRPLLFVSEQDIRGFANKYELPVAKSPCPADGQTKRAYVGELVHQINRDNPGSTERMFSAVINGHIDSWPDIIPLNYH